MSRYCACFSHFSAFSLSVLFSFFRSSTSSATIPNWLPLFVAWREGWAWTPCHNETEFTCFLSTDNTSSALTICTSIGCRRWSTLIRDTSATRSTLHEMMLAAYNDKNNVNPVRYIFLCATNNFELIVLSLSCECAVLLIAMLVRVSLTNLYATWCNVPSNAFLICSALIILRILSANSTPTNTNMILSTYPTCWNVCDLSMYVYIAFRTVLGRGRITRTRVARSSEIRRPKTIDYFSAIKGKGRRESTECIV